MALAALDLAINAAVTHGTVAIGAHVEDLADGVAAAVVDARRRAAKALCARDARLGPARARVAAVNGRHAHSQLQLGTGVHTPRAVVGAVDEARGGAGTPFAQPCLVWEELITHTQHLPLLEKEGGGVAIKLGLSVRSLMGMRIIIQNNGVEQIPS